MSLKNIQGVGRKPDLEAKHSLAVRTAQRSFSKLFTIECADFKDHEGGGRWRSYDLFTEGETLEELLDNAVYFQIDQDGGDMGFVEADDDAAQAYIVSEFDKQVIAMAMAAQDNGEGA